MIRTSALGTGVGGTPPGWRRLTSPVVRRGAPAHRLPVAEHPPAAWTPRLRDQGKGLRREQRLLVAPRVVGVRVRDESEAAHHERIEPEAVAGQRYAVVPDHLAGHSLTRVSLAKRSAGTATPTAAYASNGTPMSATRTRPLRSKRPGLGRPSVMVTLARIQGA